MHLSCATPDTELPPSPVDRKLATDRDAGWRIAYRRAVLGVLTYFAFHPFTSLRGLPMRQLLALALVATILAGCGANVSGSSGWSDQMWRDIDRSAPGGE
jgi:hypothetical protein